ncbi:NAD-dependent epimerase/dehydratase family protein [Alicyclobacillus sp.]|uniref:NAD-dependent epimerase/dehydratase family protein n=1 Tax=Alicyclobacillus sp. TaxID=61169 RepID=UPI0025C24015|nr:NAD-dependent epimerase/dehydratase family protein [Alicyclobacillus sp.]MCL6517866.1 NAD(P)H-binding protein [Alicyclobacillus sp.]
MRVFVTGGTGYVGVPVVDALVRAGHEVVVLERAGSIRPIQRPDVARVTGDVTDHDALRHGMRGCDAVVHLVGIIREFPRRGVTMQRMHVDATEAVLAAAQAAGVSRVVHMSALGARPDAVSSYHRTKWMAEELVRSSGLPYTIFRPSVIFGRGGPGPQFVGQLADLVRSAPVVPVIGDGRFALQPVAVATVAEAIVQAVHEPRDTAYELGGPDVITYLEILRRIADALGKPLRTVRVPVVLMRGVVPLLERLPSFPITRDQLTMLLEGNVCTDADAAYQDLYLEPIPFTVTPGLVRRAGGRESAGWM